MYNALYHGTSLVIAVFGQKLWIKWGHNPHFLYCGTYKNVAMYDAHGISLILNDTLPPSSKQSDNINEL